MRAFPLSLSVLLLAGLGSARAEQVVLTSTFNSFQPATFRASLNGRPVALHHVASASLDITHLVRPGRNTLTLEYAAGPNRNRYATSTFTLGGGQGGKWRTLFKRAVGVDDRRPGRATFVFMGKPDTVGQVTASNAVGQFNSFQPANFEVRLDGEVVATMNSSGNADLTGLLHPGKNVLTIRYEPGANQNIYSVSTLTIGERVGQKWNSVVKWSVGKGDKAGQVSFALYR